MKRWLLCLVLSVLFAVPSQAQIFCSQVGPSTICGGRDANGKSVSSTIAPLGGGSGASIITGNAITAPAIQNRATLDRLDRHQRNAILDEPFPSSAPRYQRDLDLMDGTPMDPGDELGMPLLGP